MIIHNSKKYYRVSEILADLHDFSAIDPLVLSRKAAIGTTVHAAIDDFFHDRLPLYGDTERGYVESFFKWYDALRPDVVAHEERFFCDGLMITGQIDAVVKAEGLIEPTLIDFKTSVQESPVWALQAHFYYHLLKVNGRSVSKNFHFIQLDKKGDLPRVYTYTFSANTWQKCWDLCVDFLSKKKKEEKKVAEKDRKRVH